jgi:hypothetical protein
MAYKNRALTDLVNKMYLRISYYDNNYNYNYYDDILDVRIDTIGDFSTDKNLTLIFTFTVPSDFPDLESAQRINYIEIYLYHTAEGEFPEPCIYIMSNSYEKLFGKKPNPNEDAKLIFTFPRLEFTIYE